MPTPGPYSGWRDMARHFRTGSALAGPVRGTPIAQVESRRVDGAEDPQQLVRAGFDVGDRELRLVRAVAGRVRTGHCGELHHGGCFFEPNVRSQSITIGSGTLVFKDADCATEAMDVQRSVVIPNATSGSKPLPVSDLRDEAFAFTYDWGRSGTRARSTSSGWATRCSSFRAVERR